MVTRLVFIEVVAGDSIENSSLEDRTQRHYWKPIVFSDWLFSREQSQALNLQVCGRKLGADSEKIDCEQQQLEMIT